jgi:hypothetical protein
LRILISLLASKPRPVRGELLVDGAHGYDLDGDWRSSYCFCANQCFKIWWVLRVAMIGHRSFKLRAIIGVGEQLA